MKHVSDPTQDNHDYREFSLGRELVMPEDCHSLGTGVEAKDTITHSESHNLASTENGSLQEVICAKMERPHYNSDGLNSCICAT